MSGMVLTPFKCKESASDNTAKLENIFQTKNEISTLLPCCLTDVDGMYLIFCSSSQLAPFQGRSEG
jgi:hypothetical protein